MPGKQMGGEAASTEAGREGSRKVTEGTQGKCSKEGGVVDCTDVSKGSGKRSDCCRGRESGQRWPDEAAQ